MLRPDPARLAVGHRPEGMPLAILCIVNNVPDNTHPGIFWTKYRGQINADISETGNVEIRRLDAHTLSLQIHNSTVEDSGVYVCTAHWHNVEANESESRTVSFDVNIFQELHFEDNVEEMEAPADGKPQNISCRVDSYSPDLSTMWEKGITAISNDSDAQYNFYENGQILQIPSYNSSVDAGIYACKVFDKRTGFVISKQVKVGE
ncbi:immunoglobulin domain-containing protein [Ditylenchus destructor]|nr:immunoglobulin domain-containing protein [Ditylenchus destructor]